MSPIPNHSRNYVVIVGEPAAIDLITEQIFTSPTGPDGDPDSGVPDFIDFEKVVPCPPELTATASPPRIVDTPEEAAAINATARTEIPGTRRQDIRAITLAEHQERLNKYGAADWYAWRIRNWGTKWGAYDAEPAERFTDSDEVHGLRLVFSTAWSAPTPIFAAIEAAHPVRVHALTIHEGGEDPTTYGQPHEYMRTQVVVEFD